MFKVSPFRQVFGSSGVVLFLVEGKRMSEFFLKTCNEGDDEDDDDYDDDADDDDDDDEEDDDDDDDGMCPEQVNGNRPQPCPCNHDDILLTRR